MPGRDLSSTNQVRAIIDSAGNELTISGTPNDMCILDEAGRELYTVEDFEADPPIVGIAEDQPGGWTDRSWVLVFDDDEERVRGAVDPLGFQIDIDYYTTGDDTHRIETISDNYEDGETTPVYYTYEYNGDNRLDTVTDPESYEHSFAYTAIGSLNRTTHTDERDNDYVYSFLAADNTLKNKTLPIIGSDIVSTVYTYDSDRNLTNVLKASLEWEYEYDGNGNRTSATDPLEIEEAWAYDSYNNVTSYTDGEENTWTFTYGLMNQPTALTSVTLPDVSTITGDSDEITIEWYDTSPATSHGLVKSVTDANGVVTEYTYDSYGHLQTEKEGYPGESDEYDLVVTTHDFDVVSRILRSYRVGDCNSSLTLAGGASGGNTYNEISQITANSCVVKGESASGCGTTITNPLDLQFEEFSTHMPDADYDEMGRPTSVYGIIDQYPHDQADSTTTFTYDDNGRLTQRTTVSDEACWANPYNTSRTYTVDYSEWISDDKVTRSTPDGVVIETTFDAMGRVDIIEGYLGCYGDCQLAYQADYAYLEDRNLVESITYDNNTETNYTYDNADRVTLIQHREWNDPNYEVVLELAYTYDDRGLITEVDEDDGTYTTTLTFEYDERRRLIHEIRDSGGPVEYNIEYEYDAGGNRTEKTVHDQVTSCPHTDDLVTTYTYDIDDPSTYGHYANRLMKYETRLDPGDDNELVELVRYEYYLDGDAAGNVEQVWRATRSVDDSVGTAEEPALLDVIATHFTYNKKSEVRIITRRYWPLIMGWDPYVESPLNLTVLAVRELRGDGRQRTLYRDRDFDYDLQEQEWFDEGPDASTNVWTDYDNDMPTADYTVFCDTNEEEAVVTDERHYSLGLSEIDYTDSDAVTYTHTDHIGTTRARTDDVPDVVTAPVYTAFGERVNSDGTVGCLHALGGECPSIQTRYGYVGRHGYETFADLDWGHRDLDDDETDEVFHLEFMHVGARWYEPATGRFLQRDPMGVRGGMNAYVYSSNSPTGLIDPKGLFDWDKAKKGAAAGAGGALIGGGTPIRILLAGAYGGLVAGWENSDRDELGIFILSGAHAYAEGNNARRSGFFVGAFWG